MAKKILHIITRIVGGGAEKNTLDTVKGLHELGYDVHLMYGGQSEEKALEKIMLPEGVRVICIPEMVREISLIKDYIAYRKIQKILKKEKYAIVHTHLAKAGVLGRMAAKKDKSSKIVHGLHGITFPNTISNRKKNIYKAIERYCAKHTDAFISVGEDIKKKYLQAKIGNESKYHVIRSGIDYEKFDEANQMSFEERKIIRKSFSINERELVVGMVSKLEKRKGYKYFIEMAAQINKKRKDVKFLIVGDGEEKEHLLNLVEEKGLINHVVFAGFRNDVAKVMSIFDVSVLTSLWEGLPQVLVQATLMSKPIVSFDVDGACEVVHEGKNGFIVPMKDVDLLAEKIMVLLNDEQLRFKMSESSRELAYRDSTVDNLVKKTEAVYTELLTR